MKQLHGFKRVSNRIPVIVFIAVIVFSVCTAYQFVYQFLDSDASSELVLGNLLAKQNKIATSDYTYSTELRFSNLNLIFMPLFKIFSGWHTVRFAGILLLQAILVGSYYFLSRQMKMSARAFFLSASLMLLPVNVLYGRFALYQHYYTPALIFNFLIVGFFLAFMRHRGEKRLWQIVRLIAMFALAFISCLNGFRQLPAVMIPLFCSTLVIAIKPYRNAPSILTDVPTHSRTQVLLAAAVLAVGFAGLWTHIHVLSQSYTFRMMEGSNVALPTVEHLRDLLVGYLQLFGFQEGRTLFSVEGLLALSGVFAAVVFFFVSLRDLISGAKPDHPAAAFMGVLYPVALLSMTAVFLLIVGYENYMQYYLTVFIWLFPYLGSWLDQNALSAKKVSVKQALIVLASLCLVLNGVFNNLYFLNPDDKQVHYDNVIPYDTAPRLEAVSNYLVENEYEVGYASFWFCNIMTEMTDGRIPMICVYYNSTNPGNMYYYDHLTYWQTREKTFVEDKSVFFLVASEERGLFNQSPIASYAALKYEDSYVCVYSFDIDTEVWEYLLAQAQKANQESVLRHLTP